MIHSKPSPNPKKARQVNMESFNEKLIAEISNRLDLTPDSIKTALGGETDQIDKLHTMAVAIYYALTKGPEQSGKWVVVAINSYDETNPEESRAGIGMVEPVYRASGAHTDATANAPT